MVMGPLSGPQEVGVAVDEFVMEKLRRFKVLEWFLPGEYTIETVRIAGVAGTNFPAWSPHINGPRAGSVGVFAEARSVNHPTPGLDGCRGLAAYGNRCTIAQTADILTATEAEASMRNLGNTYGSTCQPVPDYATTYFLVSLTSPTTNTFMRLRSQNPASSASILALVSSVNRVAWNLRNAASSSNSINTIAS